MNDFYSEEQRRNAMLGRPHKGFGGRWITGKEFKKTVCAVFLLTAGWGVGAAFMLHACAMLATGNPPRSFGGELLLIGTGIFSVICILVGAVLWDERKLP